MQTPISPALVVKKSMEEVKGLMPKQTLFKSIFKKKMADLFDQIELAH